MMMIRHRAVLALAGVLSGSAALVATVGGARADGIDTTRVRVTVVDQDGDPLRPATVMACPFEDGAADCGHATTGETNRRGVARLRLRRDVRYEFSAFVRDPEPPWPCPGFELDGSQFYFAANAFTATPDEVPRRATLTIIEPSPFDCVPVTVTDGAGNPLPTAGLFVCPLAADGTPCAAPTFDGPDPDGVIRLDVYPNVTYRLSAFIVNSGWPCPANIGPTGDTFHFSAERDVLGADLAGAVFLIEQPSPHDCVPVTVTDDAGNALPTAGLLYCGLAADGASCANFQFEGPDPDGVIRVVVDPTVTYRISAFITNSGWPCPAFTGTNGDTFHFSVERDVPGAELAAGTTTFMIRRPSAQDCG